MNNEHLEDEILNRGVAGARDAINFLQALRDMLAGHSSLKVNTTTKWDGCVHEDTIILTNNGDMTIREIVEREELWGKLEIMGKNLKSSLEYDGLNLLLAGNSSEGDKSWVELQLEDGSSIKLTEDHEVHTTNRGWVKAIEMNEGDDTSFAPLIPVLKRAFDEDC